VTEEPRSPYWYKQPEVALLKGRAYIERELVIVQIVEVVENRKAAFKK